MLCVILMTAIMMKFVKLSVILPSVEVPNASTLNVKMLRFCEPNVAILIAKCYIKDHYYTNMPSVIMLNVVMPSVMAPR